ncbi:aminoglycoside phosphotransferase [Streptomyces sp. Ru71]|uniref:aminoglycoside phosphotransferase family protein n=1 Tax=Streptomyces sp. Ru71 TaxID=2080746 RepID=UPI000CDE20E8|nr:aminoglycoside phosphotransferase family protein [Streptomyces sp. Ru71]POX52722.1 aminoglycoside phosphotransferase [Streptomyces sp. Ru71]
MAPEAVSPAWRRAAEMSGAGDLVMGPLQGHHHETYVFPLAAGPDRGPTVRWKCREPRAGLLWFDRRCFASEDQLVTALHGRITSVPEIIEVDGFRLQRFVEGETLGALHPSGTRVPDHLTDQIVDLFRQLVVVTPETLTVKRRCRAADRPENGDSDGFLERLVRFAEERVHRRNLDRFGALFTELGLDEESFERLRKHVLGLGQRPFCLLHADLHRENFVADRTGRLWTIDWELALVGDPLYDLATHLYLMRYPARQASRLAAGWAAAVERERPGSSRGWQRDLGPLIDFKRAQSVFTDVIRVALTLPGPGEPAHWRRVVHGALRLRGVLVAAAAPLGLDTVPGTARIAAALTRWSRREADTAPGAATAATAARPRG